MTATVMPDLRSLPRTPIRKLSSRTRSGIQCQAMHGLWVVARNDTPETRNDKSGSAGRCLATQARRTQARLGIADECPCCALAGTEDADTLRHQLVGHRVEQRAAVNEGHDGLRTGSDQPRQRLDDALRTVDVEALPRALLQ